MIEQSIPRYVSSNRCLLALCLIASATTLCSMLAEIYLGIHPCYLCKMQRWGFFALASVSLIGIFAKRKKPFSLAAYIVGLAVLATALYHFAVQNGWVSDPCSVFIPHDLTSFKSMIAEKNIPCSKVFSILSIPMPIWSIAVSLTCLTILSRSLRGIP